MMPSARVAAAVNGLVVIESPLLRYDEMMVSHDHPAILVGEAAHFTWRLRQIELNNECRAAGVRRIEAMATEILGEPWTVGGN